MKTELTELLKQFTMQKESAHAELCRLENKFNIKNGYTHDWTVGKHAAFLFAEKELVKIIDKVNNNLLVSSLLPSDGNIEKLALEMEARYNECHFWKRGKIFADGLRIGAKWMREKARGNLADVNF